MDYSDNTNEFDFVSTPTYGTSSFETFAQFSQPIPTFEKEDGYLFKQYFDGMDANKEIKSDVLYVVLNFTAWYVAMQDRMTDAELVMFTPVLDRMMKLVESINKDDENPD